MGNNEKVRDFVLLGSKITADGDCSHEIKRHLFLGRKIMTNLESESEVTQSCPTLCDPMDCSLSGFSVHGIFQARVLEWIAISFSRGSSRPRNRTQVSRIAGRLFTVWATLYGDQPRQHIKKQSHYFINQGPSSQGYGFASTSLYLRLPWWLRQ